MSKVQVSQLQPLAGYVLVEPAKKETKTASGFILPENDAEKPQHGTVLAVGGTIHDHGVEVKAPVKVGDKVIYKKWGGNEFTVDEIEYQFLKFEDILATIKG
jgi:chaperonin GroES